MKRFINTKTIQSSLPTIRPYKNETTPSLVNSLAVFQMCGIPLLVNNVPNFIKLAKYTGTSPVLNAVVKRTFFKHFCGGEDLKEVVPTMKKLAQSNVGSILDLAIEADLDAVDLMGVDAQMATRQMVLSLKECIDIASHQPESFIAVKVTALSPPTLLQAWSSTLRKLETAFEKIADSNGNINIHQFHQFEKSFPGLKKLDLAQLFHKNDLNRSGTLTFSDMTAIFSLFNIENCRALVDEAPSNSEMYRGLSSSDLDTAELIINEIKILCEYAQEKRVKLMMDAEQTYFQPAIDDIVIGLARIYNSKLTSTKGWKDPLIFNTYQMYLTDSLRRLKSDVERAHQKGYSFGIKLVRGAYMVSERERAMRLGIPSPIHPTIEETHKAYNAALEYVIEKQSLFHKSPESVRGLCLVVASHNHHSIETTCELMGKYGIPRNAGWVSFGQLLGMQDGVTGYLASNGFKALKYVPYGPVPVVIPYLHRRAQENGAMVEAMSSDKQAIKKEIKIRFGFEK